MHGSTGRAIGSDIRFAN